MLMACYPVQKWDIFFWAELWSVYYPREFIEILFSIMKLGFAIHYSIKHTFIRTESETRVKWKIANGLVIKSRIWFSIFSLYIVFLQQYTLRVFFPYTRYDFIIMCLGSAYPAFSYEFSWKWYGTWLPAGILLQSLFPPLSSVHTFAVNRGFIWQQLRHFSDCGKVPLSYRCIKWTRKHTDFFLSFPNSIFSCLSVIVISFWILVLQVGKQLMLKSWGYLHRVCLTHTY